MAKLPRVTNKRFGANANLSDVGQFGGAAAGTKLDTKDIAAIQALPAWSSGWAAATMSGNKYPTRQERNGVDYVHAYQIDYMLREGMPEYDSQTEYSDTSIVKAIEDDKVVFYHSIINNNIGQSLDNTAAWEKVEIGGGSSRNIGEIISSAIPLADAGLHLLDGALLQYGSYQSFIDYIADLYDGGDCTDIFETEANWQQSVTTYGVCGKFVYDSVNNTVRLPKYNSKIYTGGGTAPVIGNGLTLGLTNGTFNQGLVQNGTSGGANVLMSSNEVYGKPVGTSWTTLGNYDPSHSFGVSTDSEKSGLVANLSNITTSLDGYYYIVIATSAKTDIQVDIDQIEADLAGKADKDLTNCVTGAFESIVSLAQSSGKDTITSWGMPDYANGLSVSSPTSSSTFTAPSNGVYVELGLSPYGNDTSYLNINGVNSAYGTHNAGGYYDSHDSVTVPLNKGDEIYWTTGLSSYKAIFYPLKGAN